LRVEGEGGGGEEKEVEKKKTLKVGDYSGVVIKNVSNKTSSTVARLVDFTNG